ncbi:hypothetical protein HZH68_010939 [Vespula germanica]|uniref:Uncharacterized protein n=1 Tax=Vespula germanica TaxID=30212 RepID=A0A834JU08_VESGE|nr:hypothetical protein HZH68_010939 [Vespula germanica]
MRRSLRMFSRLSSNTKCLVELIDEEKPECTEKSTGLEKRKHRYENGRKKTKGFGINQTGRRNHRRNVEKGHWDTDELEARENYWRWKRIEWHTTLY